MPHGLTRGASFRSPCAITQSSVQVQQSVHHESTAPTRASPPPTPPSASVCVSRRIGCALQVRRPMSSSGAGRGRDTVCLSARSRAGQRVYYTEYRPSALRRPRPWFYVALDHVACDAVPCLALHATGPSLACRPHSGDSTTPRPPTHAELASQVHLPRRRARMQVHLRTHARMHARTRT